MWCTQCQVAFSWKSGKIDQGRVHNPHFYQYMQNNDMQVRAPGEQLCGGMPGYYRVTQFMRHYGMNNYQNETYINIMNLFRGLTHIQRVVIDPIRERLNRNENNMDLRVKYLANEVDEAYVAKYAAQRDNIRQKNTAMLQVLELLNVVMTEQFNNLFNVNNATYEPKEEFMKKIDNMFSTAQRTRDYCNKELEKISRNYKMKVYVIEEDYNVENKMKMYK
jgi:hypothetical protein